MRLKSHLRLNRGAERHARPRLRLTTLVTAGAVTLGLTGFAIAQAGSASADPTVQFVAVGSDTIQDVMNEYSVDIAGNLLGSYNAVNPITGLADGLTYVKGNNATQPGVTCNYSRPNGSGAGINALAESAGITLPTPTPLPTPAPASCVDIARSSSAPGGLQNNTGPLVFIPFAVDAVTGVVGPNTAGPITGITGTVQAVATNLTTAADDDFVNFLTTAELQSLYSCPSPTTAPNQGAVSVTTPSGTVLVNPNVGVNGFTLPAGQLQIDLYIPQANSGTLKFWATQMGFTAGAPPACDHQNIVNSATQLGNPVEEHNGTAMAVDPDGYGPFSIAQWISQKNHTTGDPINIDRRYGAQLQEVNGTMPTLANGHLNTSFPFVREVYNIVQFAQVDPTSGSFLQALSSMLVGQNSSLCQDLPSIIAYGFASLPVNPANPLLPDACGSTAASLRAN